MSGQESDAAVLCQVAEEIGKAAEDEKQAADTIRQVADKRRGGESWRNIASSGLAKAFLDLLAASVQRLRNATSRLRKLVMSGLSAEGLTVRQIGHLFQVSHQRVSSILGRRTER